MAFEGEARLIGALAMRLKSLGHNVVVVSCDHFNVTHSKGQVFDYFRYLGLSDAEFTHLDQVFHDLNALPIDLPHDAVDWDYLRRFEGEYCKRFSLLELAAMDPLLTGTYHHRDIYYRPDNKIIFFKYMEIQLRWLDSIFRRADYDQIFTVNFQYFIKAAFFTMADAKGIPFYMLGTCRIADLQLLFDNFSLGTPGDIVQEMQRLEAEDDPCSDAVAYIDWLKRERRPAYKDFELTMTAIREQMSIRWRIREIVKLGIRQPRSVIFIHKHYRGLLRKNYFLPVFAWSMWAHIVGLKRRIGYFRHRELTSRELPGGPFVFFALHLIPENSVLTLSRTFDELECLFQLAKALPIDWKVVVKINPNMLVSYDTHPNDYYLRMSKIPNVQFINPLIPSAYIMDKAAAVASISGTALLEGAIFGKPGLRWGHTEFEAIDIVHAFDGETLPEHLASGESRNLRFYIQACFTLGLHLDLRLLCLAIIVPLSEEQKEAYERQLSALTGRLLDRAQISPRTQLPMPATV